MTWNQQIMSWVRSLFPSLGEHATESEIHQAIQDAPNLESLQAKVRKEVQAEYDSKIQAAANEVADLKNQLASAQDNAKKIQTDLDAAQARVRELESIEGEHTKVKSDGKSGDTNQTEMPIWESYKKNLGV